MNWPQNLTKRRLFFIIIAIAMAAIAIISYTYSPNILAWVNPSNSVTITGVDYPSVAYRSQNLPVTINLSNIGNAKEVLVQLQSRDSPTLSSAISLKGSSNGKTTIPLPIRTMGDQSFSVQVTWVGPGGFCHLDQASSDRQFSVLAADFETKSPTLIASRAQGLDWSATLTNTGNTPADVTIQLYKKDSFILSDNSGGTQQISNIQVGETRTINYHFDVPSDASLADHTITLSFTTNYPDISYYKDCTETSYHDYTVTIQENPLKIQLDNAAYWTNAVLGIAGLGSIGAVVALVMGKRRR